MEYPHCAQHVMLGARVAVAGSVGRGRLWFVWGNLACLLPCPWRTVANRVRRPISAVRYSVRPVTGSVRALAVVAGPAVPRSAAQVLSPSEWSPTACAAERTG